MNCPLCGSPLKSHKSPKGVTFLTCVRWPSCRVSGTPELLERIGSERSTLGPFELPEPLRLGGLIAGVAQLRIHQSKLKQAKTAEEREAVRKQAMEAIRWKT